jgi:hypothetical protein
LDRRSGAAEDCKDVLGLEGVESGGGRRKTDGLGRRVGKKRELVDP